MSYQLSWVYKQLNPVPESSRMTKVKADDRRWLCNNIHCSGNNTKQAMESTGENTGKRVVYIFFQLFYYLPKKQVAHILFVVSKVSTW